MTTNGAPRRIQFDRLALADVRKGIEGLQQTFSKHKAAVEKLLPEIALLKRQVKALEDVHNRAVERSYEHLSQRIASMESGRHAHNEGVIGKLQTRLEAAETELKGAVRADSLPEWVFQNR